MSEKHLTELPWKMLAKKHELKDLGLQKCLGAYCNLDLKKDPAKTLDALSEILEQAGKLKKTNAANKEVASYLAEIITEANKTKQVVGQAAKIKAPEPEPEADDKDIKGILLQGFKKVRTLENGESIAFVACVAKPCYGLLLAKSTSEKIGAAHRKTLTELTAGTKFIVGTCIFENETHTFIVEKVPGGLARNLKKAIKEFTGQTYRVRVRDLEGKVVTDGDADATPEEADTPEPQPAAQAVPQTTASVPPSPIPTPQTAEPSASTASTEAMSKFTTRFKGLQPDILKAIAAKTPRSDEVRQRAKDAGALADKNDFEQAHRVLDGLESVLKTPSAPTPSPIPGAPPGAKIAQPNPVTPSAQPPKAEAESPRRPIRLSTYLSGRANLRVARENAEKELRRLQQEILAKSAGEPFYADIEAKSQKLFDYLKAIDDSVVNKLDDAGKCPDPELQLDLNKKVRELIQRQLSALSSHALASFVEKNPFGKFIIKQPLVATLSALDRQLS